MPHVASKPSLKSEGRIRTLASRIGGETPSFIDCVIALVSATLLIFSFPDFSLWPLAWVALVPLLILIVRDPRPGKAFFLGWLFGSVFFYGTCYWLTYSMVHFGGIPSLLAFAMLVPGALLLGLFPAAFAYVLSRTIRKFGPATVFFASVVWPALEWLRLGITGQLWNAIGYSQAFHPALIQTASWAGVYGVGFLMVAVNSAVAFAIFKRDRRALMISAGVVTLVVLLILVSKPDNKPVADQAEAIVVAVQPNVPMDLVKSTEDMAKLSARHFEMSEGALKMLAADDKPRLVVWPESPMNFGYGGDTRLREMLAAFAKANHTSILLNSQEVAPNDGLYNSAVLINQEGSLVAQYDKIRLLPFGEYVPLPQWVPGAGLIRGIVGDFTPGTNFRLMPVGNARAGVFICIESAYPSIARTFTREGADVLINISNDGYLGPTAVIRQHLANAVFRAVENGRPLLRVTNTGITAFITPAGEVKDETQPFQTDVRTWQVTRAISGSTFYSNHGDVFAAGFAVISLLVFLFSFRKRKTLEAK